MSRLPALLASAALLGACQAPGAGGSLGGLGHAAAPARLAVRTPLDARPAAGYRLAAVPAAWDRAVVTLAHPTLLTAPLTRTLTAPGSQTAIGASTTHFDALRPGAGYTVTLALERGGTTVGRATRGGLTLLAGTNQTTLWIDPALVVDRLAGASRAAAPATRLPLDARDVAVDGAGGFYAADAGGHALYRVNASGDATLIAGLPGQAGATGDGGAATAARLNGPAGVARAANGDLYVADTAGNRVRRIRGTTITTVVGTGAAGFAGDGGAAGDAKLQGPTGLVFDNDGNLYVCDAGNARVRRVATDGTITTVLGGGATSLVGLVGALLGTGAALQPTCLAYDAGFGTLYVGDAANVGASGKTPLVALDLHTGYVSLVLPALFQGALNKAVRPAGLAVDAATHAVYVADQAAGTILRVPLLLGIALNILGLNVTIVLQNTPTTLASGLSLATTTQAGLAFQPATSELVACEPGKLRILGVATNGTKRTLGGLDGYTGDGGTGAAFGEPAGLARDAAGNAYLADAAGHRVRKIDTAGVVTTLMGSGTAGTGMAQLDTPRAVAIDAIGTLYVADAGNHRVLARTSAGVVSLFHGTGTAGTGATQLSGPQGVALDGAGGLWIADTGNHRIKRLSAAGALLSTAGTGTAGFAGDGGAAAAAKFDRPAGLAVDGGGNLYVADTTNRRVRKIAAGSVSTVAGNGTATVVLGQAATATGLACQAVAIDAAGALFVADPGNHAVYKVDGRGTLVGVAGVAGTPGFAADGADAVSSKLLAPAGLACGPANLLLVAEGASGLVRRLHEAGTP